MSYFTAQQGDIMHNMAFHQTLHCFLRQKTIFGETRLGMSVTTQGGSGRQYVTGPGRNISKYRFVLLMGIVFGRLKTQ